MVFSTKMVFIIALGVTCAVTCAAADDIPVVSCTHKGLVYNAGDTFSDDCHTCLCTMQGTAICLACDDDATTCNYKGAVYSAGDTFNDDCNTCRCTQRGVVVCTKKACDEDIIAICDHQGED